MAAPLPLGVMSAIGNLATGLGIMGDAIYTWSTAGKSPADGDLKPQYTSALTEIRKNLDVLQSLVGRTTSDSHEGLAATLEAFDPIKTPLAPDFTSDQALTALKLAERGVTNAQDIADNILEIDKLEEGAATKLGSADVQAMLDRYLLAIEVRPPGMFLSDPLWQPPFKSWDHVLPEELVQSRAYVLEQTDPDIVPDVYGPNLFTAIEVLRAILDPGSEDVLNLDDAWRITSVIDTGGAWFADVLKDQADSMSLSQVPLQLDHAGAVSLVDFLYHIKAMDLSNAYLFTVDTTPTAGSPSALTRNGLSGGPAYDQQVQLEHAYNALARSVKTPNPYTWDSIRETFGTD